MNLSPLTLRHLAEELHRSLAGLQIRSTTLERPYDLYLELEGGKHLLLSASPDINRLVTCSHPNSAGQEAPSWAHQHIQKSRIDSISAVPLERIVEIILSSKDRLGTDTRYRLIAELMGRNSNVILVAEPKGSILGALRQIGGKQNRIRQILPGKSYLPPPPLNRIPPTDVTPKELFRALSESTRPLTEALTYSVAGLDTLLSKELLSQANFSTEFPDSPVDLEPLCRAIREFMENPPYLTGAALVPDPTGIGNAISVIGLKHTRSIREFPSTSEAIQALVLDENSAQERSSRILELEKSLGNQMSSTRRKLSRIESDLKEAEQADQIEKYGNLLLANLHRVTPGSSEVILSDLFSPGEPDLEVPLDPSKPAVETAQEYLKRSKKARKALPILKRRLEIALRKIDRVEAYLKTLHSLNPGTELQAFRGELESAGIIRTRKQKGPRSQTGDKSIHPRRYLTTDGWTLLVGRNSAENDRLTKSSAKDDIFFHAQGCPGSHVILKREGKPDRPAASAFKEAASLAAFWSKARGAKSVPVSYTDVRYVQKRRGAPAGQVMIRNEKTLMVQPRELKRTNPS